MKNNENGRSMVEMLGVLAIIGVLSVAGIVGYTIAMRKYRANEIAHAISEMAVLARTANRGVGISSQQTYTQLVGAATNPSGAVTLRANVAGNPAVFNNTISVEVNSHSLCVELENMIGPTPTNPIYVTAINGCPENDGTTMTVTVNN